MRDKITRGWRAARLRLAQMIAPPGHDVHDPDETLCPSYRDILEATAAGQLTVGFGAGGQTIARMDVSGQVAELDERYLVKKAYGEWGTRYELTPSGEVELIRLRVLAWRVAGRPVVPDELTRPADPAQAARLNAWATAAGRRSRYPQ